MPGHDPGLQRHHLLPRQVLHARGLTRFIDAIDPRRFGFHDFRRNGLLLPANDTVAWRLGLPLHRGPHRIYNDMVLDRLGAIEADWSRQVARFGCAAPREALSRIELLQRALRRGLLGRCETDRQTHAFALSRRDPRLRPEAFAPLDAMADRLWGAAANQDVRRPAG